MDNRKNHNAKIENCVTSTKSLQMHKPTPSHDESNRIFIFVKRIKKRRTKHEKLKNGCAPRV